MMLTQCLQSLLSMFAALVRINDKGFGFQYLFFCIEFFLPGVIFCSLELVLPFRVAFWA